MDVNALTTAIGSLGFPIVACIALFMQNEKLRQTIDANTAAIREMLNQIKEEHARHE